MWRKRGRDNGWVRWGLGGERGRVENELGESWTRNGGGRDGRGRIEGGKCEGGEMGWVVGGRRGKEKGVWRRDGYGMRYI